MKKYTLLEPQTTEYTSEDWEQFVENGNFEPMKAALQNEALTLSSWLLSIKLVILNCQYSQAEDVFNRLLKYKTKNIYMSLNGNGTLLHLLISKLNRSTYEPQKVKILCRMIKTLLETEAQERLQQPENNSLFLEQMPTNERLKSTALDLLDGTYEPSKSVKQQLLIVIVNVEKKYPKIIQLKEQAEIIANGGNLTETSSFSPTLSNRHSSSATATTSFSSSGKQQSLENKTSPWWNFSWLFGSTTPQKNTPPQKPFIKCT